jgi:hypothetical protein
MELLVKLTKLVSVYLTASSVTEAIVVQTLFVSSSLKVTLMFERWLALTDPVACPIISARSRKQNALAISATVATVSTLTDNIVSLLNSTTIQVSRIPSC